MVAPFVWTRLPNVVGVEAVAAAPAVINDPVDMVSSAVPCHWTLADHPPLGGGGGGYDQGGYRGKRRPSPLVTRPVR